MPKIVRRYSALIVAAALVLFSVGTPALAQYQAIEKEATAEKMVVDALLARPFGLLATAVGGVLYVVSLPFSALGGNSREAWDMMVMEPVRYTFDRPLGEF